MSHLGFLLICLRLTGRVRRTNRNPGYLQRLQLGTTAHLHPWLSSHPRRICSIFTVRVWNNVLSSQRVRPCSICAHCIRSGFGFMLVGRFTLQVTYCLWKHFLEEVLAINVKRWACPEYWVVFGDSFLQPYRRISQISWNSCRPWLAQTNMSSHQHCRLLPNYCSGGISVFLPASRRGQLMYSLAWSQGQGKG